MPGPYLIKEVQLLSTLPGKDAVIPDSDTAFGVQCVGLVKYYSDAGPTSTWQEGASLSDGDPIMPGTAIATFNSEGRYASKKTGNHACFFVSFLPGNAGIRVLEQHVKPTPDKIQLRSLKFKGSSEIDDASAYAVIL
jgi:hypothetical protein